MKYLCVICAILLLLAIPTWLPYDFYILLRWVIFVSSIYISYIFYKSKLKSWMLIFIAVAFLFNPIIPLYLNKSNWVPIDLIAMVLFFITAYSKKEAK